MHVIFYATNPQRLRKVLFYDDDDVGSPKESFPTSEKVLNINPFEGYSLQHTVFLRSGNHLRNFLFTTL